MSPADSAPDFDKMSPEELMAWMESLAKRQGANEGFTTAADLDIPEVDPSTVQVDEPGYIPYGMDPQKWAEKQAQEAAKRQAARAQAAPASPAVPPTAPASPPAPAAEMFSPPPRETFEPEPAGSAVPDDALSWLESLAADQGVPELDLSALAADLSLTPATAESSAPPVNPMDWLESLAQEQTAMPVAAPDAPPVADPLTAGVDPMAWLESLAMQQGARREELTTPAGVSVPPPESFEEVAEGPGYTPYAFDAPMTLEHPGEEGAAADASRTPRPALEPADLQDPAAWLDRLATGQGFSTEAAKPSEPEPAVLTDDEIQRRLARGEDVPHEQMQAWMNRQLEIGAQREEPELAGEEYDPDAPPVPAELPDWLLEQVGPPAEEPAKPPAPEMPPALIEAIVEPPPAVDMPDWLKEDVEAPSDLDSIFASIEPAAEPVVALPFDEPVAPPAFETQVVSEAEMDVSDPWSEALEYERQHGSDDVLPDWYTANINDPSRRAAVDSLARDDQTTTQLAEGALEPEADLPLGEPQDVPDWLQDIVADEPAVVEEIPNWLVEEVTIDQPQAAVTPASESTAIPEWLRDVELETSEVPDWLTQTLGTQEQPVVIAPPAPEPPPAPVRPAPPPAPRPAVVIDVSAVLSSARAHAQANDLDACLNDYEQLVRASAELETVAADLAHLADKHRTNAAVYRVLGDSLMRQGKLQAALDTYRKALNQL